GPPGHGRRCDGDAGGDCGDDGDEDTAPPAQGRAPSETGETATQSIHDRVRMKEPGLERMLFVDAYPRAAFMDHFYATDTGVAELVAGTAVELGDFAGSAYTVASLEEVPHAPAVTLARTGTVAGHSVSIRKTISLDRGHEDTDGVTVRYVIEVAESTAVADGRDFTDVLFAPEVNLTLLAGWSHDRYVLVDDVPPPACFLADSGTHPGATSVTLVDETRGLRVRLSWGRAAGLESTHEAREVTVAEWEAAIHAVPAEAAATTLLRHGVVTVSLSEDGFERIYQSTALLPSTPMRLEAGRRLLATLRLDVSGS
ncbi:MAG TPA: alpha-amylase/4-alpha-glucanotransferase domain-containing protein, partial [Thermoleophilia bacterium]|nr:alpha-amylase/4-alpha-glucanotransferase domain-containing protein [Thermoleophilia bacterium]